MGQGALFEVMLPARAASPVPQGVASPSSGPEPGAVAPVSLDQLTLLVVDDDLEIRELLRVALEQRGASVILAASVAEGLAAMEQSRPDVIVCDIGMPGSDGYAFIKRLRSRPGPHGTVPAIASLVRHG